MNLKIIIVMIIWGFVGYLSGFNDCEYKDRDCLKGMCFWMLFVLVFEILERVMK